MKHTGVAEEQPATLTFRLFALAPRSSDRRICRWLRLWVIEVYELLHDDILVNEISERGGGVEDIAHGVKTESL